MVSIPIRTLLFTLKQAYLLALLTQKTLLINNMVLSYTK